MIGLLLRHKYTSAERIIIEERATDMIVLERHWSSGTVRLAMSKAELGNWVIQ